MTMIGRQTLLSELALTVLSQQLGELRAHEPGTRAGSDPEELHDMRVATRRLRAALRCFEDVLPPEARELRQELAWLGGRLAAVRDLDVLSLRIDELIAASTTSDRPAVIVVRQELDNARYHARAELADALDAERYAALLAAADALLRTDIVPGSDATVEAAAPRLVGTPFRKLRKLGDRLDSTSPATDLHALRIRAKRLRYAVEFIAQPYGRPAQRFVRSVVNLQDVLGQHQDAQVAVARLHSLASGASELPPDVLFTMGKLAQRHMDEGARLRANFPRTYKAVTGRRWRELRRAL